MGFPKRWSTRASFAALAAIVSMLVLARVLPTRRPALVVGLVCVSAIAVGASRLMVGAHYFTDVIAGSVFGVAIAAAVAIVTLSSHARARIAHWLPFFGAAVRPR